MDSGSTILLKKSRKAFLIEYFCGVFLIGSMPFLNAKGISLPEYFQYFVLGFGLFAIASAELARQMTRYRITPEKFTVIKGIIMQHRKNVHFHPLGFVPDINLKQNRIQRLLNYGNIFIQGSGENSIEMRDINNPDEIMRIIETRIEQNRTPSSKRRNI